MEPVDFFDVTMKLLLATLRGRADLFSAPRAFIGLVAVLAPLGLTCFSLRKQRLPRPVVNVLFVATVLSICAVVYSWFDDVAWLGAPLLWKTVWPLLAAGFAVGSLVGVNRPRASPAVRVSVFLISFVTLFLSAVIAFNYAVWSNPGTLIGKASAVSVPPNMAFQRTVAPWRRASR